MSKEESIPTPTFAHVRVDFSQLLKERITKSTNALNNKEYRKIKSKLNNIKYYYLSKIKDIHLSSKSSLPKKHHICKYCPDIIFKNIYDRKYMYRFISEKEKAFEGSELENKTIDSEQN